MNRCSYRYVGTFLVLTILSILSTPAFSESIPDNLVSVEPLEPLAVRPGDQVQVLLNISIHKDWHINSNPASKDFLIPTEVKAPSTGGVRLENVDYPEGENFEFEFVPEPISVYQGEVTVPMTFQVREDHPGGHTRIPLELIYQACDDTRCLPPETKQIKLQLQVSGEGGKPIPGVSESDGWGSFVSLTQQSDPDALGGIFSGKGILVGLIIVFFLGLSLNLTPCVYPMVPITVGFFGSGKTESFSRRLADAVFFVLGMVIVYSLLGALAGMGGQILGDILQSAWVQVGLAGLMVVLSGTMFGFYQLQLPATLQRKSENMGKTLGTFGMGMTLGVVAAPCLAPATVALLGYVGKTQNALAGAGLFFVLSLGLGLPYVFLALFSSQLNKLPGSGEWMEWVKTLLGFVILAVALYFLWPLLNNVQFGYALVGLLVIATGTLIFTHLPETRLWSILRTAAVLAVATVLIFLISQTFISAEAGIQWESGESYLRETEGQSVKQPTVIYLSADWCVPCKEMEVTTFRNPTIKDLMSRTRSVKIDLSNPPPTHVQNWLDSQRVLGVPTIFFFTPEQGLHPDLTIMGYASVDDLKKPLSVISTE